MTFHCQEAQTLIPSYLDGELSEAQAGPLRKHLMDCHSCRGAVQSEKNLKRWFPAAAQAEIPDGFAARVARRAFAGDTGEEPQVAAETRAGEGRLLQFVLQATAVAAVLLVVLSISIRTLSLPQSGDMMADDRVEMPLEQHLDELERMNADEEDPKDEERRQR